jgi:hypothetical protein
MNAIVDFTKARKVKPPLEIQVEALKREVKALKAELRDERAHTVNMLAIMRGMGERRASAVLCQCEQCTCTPTRADVLLRRR